MIVQADLDHPMPGISPGIYGRADFLEAARIVHAEAGILLPEGKAMLVYSRLAPLVRESGCTTFAAYLERARDNQAELARIVSALTTNHTFFYREAHHFEHFAATVRPELLARVDNGHAARLWSAGCSSGEETWSLALTLLGSNVQAGRKLARRDLRILASDIAPDALERAQGACYPLRDMNAVPQELVRLWTRQDGELATLSSEPRGIVRFRHLNLQADWPMAGQFDVIFCRNVMIYFDQPTKERLVARFAAILRPSGHLYIGHSERVTGPATDLLEPVGPTIYRRRPQ